MSVVAVAPIVEGYGDVEAVRTLIERVLQRFTPECVPLVARPIRVSKSKVTQDYAELLRAVDLAALNLREMNGDRKFVLLILDADYDLACQLAPTLVGVVNNNRGHVDFSCVFAVKEFETWLAAGAETWSELLVNGFEEHISETPEDDGIAKGWVQQFFQGTKYSESVDQVRLTARFDVDRARTRSNSFDKLCRELESRCA